MDEEECSREEKWIMRYAQANLEIEITEGIETKEFEFFLIPWKKMISKTVGTV